MLPGLGFFWYFFLVKIPWTWQDIRKPHGFQRIHKRQRLAWYLRHPPALQSLCDCHPTACSEQGRESSSFFLIQCDGKWTPYFADFPLRMSYEDTIIIKIKRYSFSVVTVCKSGMMLILPLQVVCFSLYYFSADNLNQMFQFWCN